MQRAALLLMLLLPTASWAGSKEAVAVLDIQGTGIDEALLPTLTEILTVEIHSLGKHKVIAGRDIQAMLGFEKQKDVLGCTDAACLAEIGGALGVERIVAGHIGKVGSTYVVNIKLINIRMADTEGRVYETVRGEVDALIDTIRKSVSKLFGASVKAPTKTNVAAAPPPKPTPQPAPKPHQHEAAKRPHQATADQSAAMPRSEPKPESKKVAAAAEPAQPATVTREVKKDDGGGIGPWPWVLWGIGGLSLAGGLISGRQAKQLEDCANDSECEGGQVDAEDAPRRASIANLLFGVGGGCVGLGLLIALLSGDDDDDVTALAPMVGPSSVGFALSGEF